MAENFDSAHFEHHARLPYVHEKGNPDRPLVPEAELVVHVAYLITRFGVGTDGDL